MDNPYLLPFPTYKVLDPTLVEVRMLVQAVKYIHIYQEHFQTTAFNSTKLLAEQRLEDLLTYHDWPTC